MNMKAFKYIYFVLLVVLGCRGERDIIKSNTKIDNSIIETQYYKLFTDATKQALFGNYQSAIPLYMACIELFPDRAAPYYQLSSIYIRSQDENKAVNYAEMSYNLDTANIWYTINLANIYQYLGYLDSAANIYLKILKKRDDNELRYNLAVIYSQMGSYASAEQLLKKIDENIPGSREILLMRHSIFNKQRNYDSAVYELELLTEYFPDEISNYGILAEYLTEIGKREYAKKVYRDILKIDSTNGLSMISFGEFYLNSDVPDSAFYYFGNAFLYSDLKYEDKIGLILNYISNKEFLVKYSEQLLKLINCIDPDKRDVSFYTTKADIFIRTEQYDKAKPCLDSSLIFQKDNYLLWEQTLLVNSFLGNDLDVIKISSDCIKYFPKKPGVYMFKAYSENNLNESDSAIKDANLVISFEPANELLIQSYILLAEIYREKQMHGLSDEYFDKILVLDPGNLPIRNNYAYYLSLRGQNLQKAKELSKLTVEKEPNNATYLDTYGWVLYKLGRFSDAKTFIENAIRNGAFDNPEVIEHYGDIMKALERCHEALEAYEKVIEIDSTYLINNKIESLKDKCR